METLFDRMAQREAADALLDRGLSVPLFTLRLPWRRKPLQLRAVMRRPRLGGMLLLAREYLALGITADRFASMSREEQMAFLVKHGKRLSRMAALTLCRGRLSCLLLARPLAHWVRWSLKPELLRAAVADFLFQFDTRPFTNTISLAERTNPMKPRLSRDREGSQGGATSPPIAPSDSSGR